MLIALDDEKNDTAEEEVKGKESIRQKKYIFCKENDRDALFKEIDEKVSVPLIPEFKDYIIDTLIERKILIPLEVLSIAQRFDAYMLRMRNDEKEVIDIVNRGLASGAINNTPMKPLIERHNVYYDLLRLLYLNNSHYKDLADRGLSAVNIRQFMYKSLPANEYECRNVIKNLCQKHDLSGIPGFYCKYGEWKMYMPKYGGFFVPVCDKDGYIQGMQIRLDSDTERYRWFSTNEYPEGTGVSSWVHVVGNTSSDTAYLTEGALKADVTSTLSGGELFIAIPGVNAVTCLADTLRRLKLKKVYEAFDMDKQVNVNVMKALARIKEILKECGIETQTCTWNPWYKGIDDYVLYRNKRYGTLDYDRQAA